MASTGDNHTATVNAPPGATFAPFDRVSLKWRVTYNTWGQASGRNAEEVVLIEPNMRVTISPPTITAGEKATGVIEVIELAQPRAAETVVRLEVKAKPPHAGVTLAPGIVRILPNATSSESFTIRITPVQTGPGGVVGFHPNNCDILATVVLDNGDTVTATGTFGLLAQQN